MKKYIFIITLIITGLFFQFLPNSTMTKKEIKNNPLLEGNFELTSEKLIIENNYIKSVPAKTEKDKFIPFFKVNNATLGIKCENGTNYIGSNCILNVTPSYHTTLDYKIVVTGDLNGDGVNSVTDAIKMENYKNDKTSLKEESYILASDIDNNKDTTDEDISSLAQYVVRNKTIPVTNEFTNLKSIEVLTKSLVITIGTSKQIEYKTESEDVIINWKSSNENIVKVDETGKVTAITGGTSTITATTSQNETINISIEVVVIIPPTGLTLADGTNSLTTTSNITMNSGTTKTILATISPTNATNKKITWTSNNTNIATVDSTGKIIAKSSGTATITAKTENGISTSFKVTVIVPVTSITLSQTSLTLYTPNTTQLTATINPTTATDKNITWTSSDSSIATVDSTGKVTAKSSGTVTITAISSNGVRANCTVKVNNPTISVNQTSITIMDEESTTIPVTLTGTTMNNITWISSNPSIATVSVSGNNLIIKGNNVEKNENNNVINGHATITGTVNNNKKITQSIEINVRPVKIFMVGNSKTYTKNVGDRLTEIAKSEKNGYTNGLELNVTWFKKSEGVGGKTLNYIYKNNSSRFEESYDYVIMQEQAPGTLSGEDTYKNYYNGVTKIVTAVKKANPKVKLYLRKTWLKEENTTKDIEDSFSNTTKISKTVSEDLNTPINLIEDGPSMYEANDSGLEVFADSTLHQTELGADLIASCVYATVFDKDPTLNPYTNTTTQKDLTKIKTIAKNNCYN